MIEKLPAKQETWVRSLVQEDPLEEEMAMPSSILAWEIPWTEEPGGLQSVGSQREGHKLVERTANYVSEYSRLDLNVFALTLIVTKIHISLIVSLRMQSFFLGCLKMCAIFLLFHFVLLLPPIPPLSACAALFSFKFPTCLASPSFPLSPFLS